MKKILDRLSRLYNLSRAYNVFNYAARLAYAFMLAFLPLLMLMHWVLLIVFDGSSASVQVFEYLGSFLPKSLYQMVLSILDQKIVMTGRGLTGLMTMISNVALLFFVLYAAVRAVRTWMVVSTRLCGYTETRGLVCLWRDAARNLLIVLGTALFTIYMYLSSQIVADKLLYYLSFFIAVGWLKTVWKVFTFFYLGLFTTLLLCWALATFSAEKHSFKAVLPGSLVTLALWTALLFGTKLFNVVLGYEDVVSFLDSSISFVVIFYLLSLALIAGMLVNLYLSRRRIRKQKGEGDETQTSAPHECA